MTHNKRTVDRYMDGFRRSDHLQILSCLADDVEWDIPGAFHVRGKEEFDRQRRERLIRTHAETVIRELVTVEIVPAFQTVNCSTQILGPLDDEVSVPTRADLRRYWTLVGAFVNERPATAGKKSK